MVSLDWVGQRQWRREVCCAACRKALKEAYPRTGDTVSTEIYDKLSFFEQYAAAAYCKSNNNSTDTKVTCDEQNCSHVEAADTNTLTEFEK